MSEFALGLMSDEDGERCFVEVSDDITESVVYDQWRQAAEEQWGIKYEDANIDIVKNWYKPHDEGLIQCSTNDPDRDSEWWSFELPPEKQGG